ncbi:DUF262 domain-containing protein [Sphingopyxis kveilinensis]|uniref:DUF262 domain-containing protein n=1 Tax=Sphingopyxis kveilinensis TaxID=3114367 RepID=UPI0030D52272
MQTPLNASASSAGALLSNATFEIPPFQREYSWGTDEVTDFWTDLSNNIDSDSYFLGLIILTDSPDRKSVVDGQQRLITLTLLANAIYHEASKRGREALADRIQADFIRAIDYDSDETAPRVKLSDLRDDGTLQAILDTGIAPQIKEKDSVSARMAESYDYLLKRLKEDLAQDPFKRLGKWTKFLTDRLYFAVFVHPDSSSAYQVYEVINTRGKELTTADLLKNYVLSQTPPNHRADRYEEWQLMQRRFVDEGTNNFVQFIRHAVTVDAGHVLPKDLFGFLAGRLSFTGKNPPTVPDLMALLSRRLPIYLQMIDPSLDGPAQPDALKVFSALNSLGVIAVRPLLLAIADVPNAQEGMEYVLRLVVRRIVVGNLGTGNVERRFGEAARKIADTNDWTSVVNDLRDLNPSRDDFARQLKTRSFNKSVLAFMRRSVVEDSMTPERYGTLHFIWTRQADNWSEMSEEDGVYWSATIGNTFLAELERRPIAIDSWEDFKARLLPYAIEDEWSDILEEVDQWDAEAVDEIGEALADAAATIWFD